MAQRRRRIAQEDRERIVRAFEEPEQDYLVVADTLGVNRSTARGIVARFIRENRVDERPRGGRNNVKVNEEMRQCLEAILEENPMLTLEAINRKLREELPDRPHVHVRTVAKHLDGMLYTLKLAHTVPADRNRADVIQRRNEYAHWFLEEANLNHTVFIDECGFNICMDIKKPGAFATRRQSLPSGVWAERKEHYNMFGNISSVWVDISQDSVGRHDRCTFQRVSGEHKRAFG